MNIGALANTTARATKTSLAIKMKVRFFTKNFYFNSLKMADTGELSNGVLGTAPKFGLREVFEFVTVFTSSKQRRKRKFTVVFVHVVKKSALDVQNLLFSFPYWAHCRRRHRHPRRCSQDLSMCVNSYESGNVFSNNAFHIFARYTGICSLRKHPFLLALRRLGRFARRNVCDSVAKIPY